MGAFVGNHECVAVINNYVPKEAVYYYTRKQPLEEKAKLPLELAKPLHELVMLVSSFILGHSLYVTLFFNVSDEYKSCESGINT